MRECNCHRGPEVRKKVIGCPPKVININHPAEPVLFHRVDIPAAMGDDTTYPPENGLYKNVLLVYEANNHIYLYNSDGIPTSLSLDISELEETVGDLQEGLANEAEERLNTDIALREDIDDVAQDLEDFKNSPDVVDIVPTYAALQAYDTSELGDNDEIRVLADETRDGASAYYRWDKTNSQWIFIGITGPYYTKTETDTLIEAAKTAWAGTETTSSSSGSTAEVTTTTGDFEWKTGNIVTVNFAYKASRSLLKIDSETAYSIDNVRSLSGGIDTGVAIQYVCTTVGGQRAYRPIGRLRASSDVAGPVFIEDNLTTTGTQLKALSANQGKVLDDKITALQSSKQDNLSAGNKISINNNTVSLIGDSITVLTPEDYDYPVNNPDGIALWSLPVGIYKFSENSMKCYKDTLTTETKGVGSLLIKYATDEILLSGFTGGHRQFPRLLLMNGYGTMSSEYYILSSNSMVDNLGSISTDAPLAANQGRVLNGYIGNLSTLTTTNRTSTVAAINELVTTIANAATPISQADWTALWS